jgi:putative oxidoreductase
MSDRRAYALLILRLSLGLLMLVWGSDKLVNPEHGVQVFDTFYFGALSSRAIMPVLGALQIILGLAVLAGVARRYAYPILAAVTGITLIGVWRSVVDPWGWFLEGANVLFFPSLIIFAAVLVLMAVRDDDRFVVGRREPATVNRS